MSALHILHVDDEPDIREIVGISLGLDPELVTRSCGSGEEAMELALDWHPDMILLDVMMPMMDGPKTLACLRGNPQTAGIPVIFMTARAQTRELDLFRSLGAVGVIPKPFDPMTLAASVRSYVMPPDNPLESLRGYFRQRIKKDAAALTKLRSVLKDRGATPAALIRIKHIAHGLAGSGGIYGFFEISEAASALEEAANAGMGNPKLADGINFALDRLIACV
jgi:two-component system OmpR family response regulator